MDTSCLAYGFVISLIVSFLKRWPWAANNPKIIATVISSAFSLGSLFVHGNAALTLATIQSLATCITTQLAASVATHEVVVQSLKDYAASKLTNA